MAATVVTAVVFSATNKSAEVPPPSLVMTGALSLTGVIVIANVPDESVPLPSSTRKLKLSLNTSAPLWS